MFLLMRDEIAELLIITIILAGSGLFAKHALRRRRNGAKGPPDAADAKSPFDPFVGVGRQLGKMAGAMAAASERAAMEAARGVESAMKDVAKSFGVAASPKKVEPPPLRTSRNDPPSPLPPEELGPIDESKAAAALAAQGWHLLRGSEVYGPFALDDLRVRVRELGPETRVWSLGFKAWVEARAVPGLMRPVGAGNSVPAAG